MSDEQTLANERRRLRPLLPASTPGLPLAATGTAGARVRTVQLGSACEACRTRKSKATANADVLDLLRNLPEAEALSVLKKIRSGADVGTVVSHVRDGNLLLQMALEPESRFRYSFPYRSELPEDIVANNLYLDSFIYEASSLYSSAPAENARTASVQDGSLTHFARRSIEDYHCVYLKPFHSAQLIEPLLADARVSVWTTVCDDDALMRDLLGVWFRCEYQVSAAFQKDYFLEDLASGRQDFCSSLLVNAVLAYSCVCYPRFSDRSEYWKPQTLHYRFLAEAKRLWELEAMEPRITTIQAGIIFNVIHNLCGLDEIGQPYRIHAVALAQSLGLLDGSSPQGSLRMQNAYAYTAWTLYNWESIVAFSFVIRPLLREPPKWPLPDPASDLAWYGEFWVKYPLRHSLTPASFGQVFRARSQFRVIMNDYSQAACSPTSKPTHGEANQFRARLDSWFAGLPKPLLPRFIVLPGHLQLHMHYHYLLLTIHEPLREMIFPNEWPSPQQIVTEASKHLQTLLRLYFLRHGFEAMDIFLIVPLMLLGDECICALAKQTAQPGTIISPRQLEALRSTLILVAQGLYQQRRSHYLAEALFRVVRGRMHPAEAALLKNAMALDEQDGAADAAQQKRAMAQPVRSHWPVRVVRDRQGLDEQVLKKLVDSYAHLNIE
ncbi:putative C6 transcription factor [Microdochium bolleyi]|uniref:Putative C6 transcription factor n=1 Tax=Microdochium bolleyi TaxID=196109 RepID=A0A136IM66_9PEZI|nr:putative C6 transcription factor [Microdochium bolleyi]